MAVDMQQTLRLFNVGEAKGIAAGTYLPYEERNPMRPIPKLPLL